MDKRPVYPGAIPTDTDLLQPQRNAEIALGFIMQAAFGTNTVIDGLTVTQQASPNMTVKVGPGSIIFSTTVDTLTSGFGSLPVDNADPLVKIGVNLASTTMSALTAPATTGQSQNWLIEAQFLEADGSAAVLNYYNSTNPAIPFTGPGNAGTTNNTARTNTVQLQWKGGTPATTGTQNTPSPDAGWVGVAIVTVANGQSTIVNANITPYSLAPYVPTKLPFQRVRLLSDLSLFVATTGSDTANSGLSASSPFATLQKAWNLLSTNYDLNGHNVTVNIADGAYSSATTACLNAIGGPIGITNSSAISFVGNVTTPANVTVSGTSAAAAVIATGSNVNLTISGMTLNSVATDCIRAQNGAQVVVGSGISFATSGNAHMAALQGGIVFISANYKIVAGSTSFHMLSSGSAQLSAVASVVCAITGTPTVGSAFAQASSLGLITVVGWSESGSMNTGFGARYLAVGNGVINTGGGGAGFFPALAAAGSTGSGGQYL